jgi:hypothetical protein
VTYPIAIVLLWGVLLPSCDRGPPKRLVPPGAVVERELPRTTEQCFMHRTWLMRASPTKVESWAAANDLPCADHSLPCTEWSTDKRTDPFWGAGSGEPNGLDKVSAKLVGTELTVEWGDYTCSGWN